MRIGRGRTADGCVRWWLLAAGGAVVIAVGAGGAQAAAGALDTSFGTGGKVLSDLGTASVDYVRAVAAATPASAARPQFALNIYDIKVAVKGGTTLTNTNGGSYNGDMVQEHSTGSFSVDGTVRQQPFFSGTPPRGLPHPPNEGGGGGKVAVNGTWSDQGTKWVDVVNGVTGPFTCGGKIGAHVQPTMDIRWKRSGSKLEFTLQTVQQELANLGSRACPNDSDAGWLQAISTMVNRTQFSIPTSEIGRQTIVKQISGPLAQNRKYLTARSGETHTMAWHGVVRFSRVRVIKANAGGARAAP